MKRTIVTLVTFLAMGGCSAEFAEAERDRLVAFAFPDPADRVGIAVVFPLESAGRYPKLMVTHFSDELTMQDVAQRVAGFCERQDFRDFTGRVLITHNNGTGTTTRDGKPRPLAGYTYACERSG